jgi:FkbM family methyltransferase
LSKLSLKSIRRSGAQVTNRVLERAGLHTTGLDTWRTLLQQSELSPKTLRTFAAIDALASRCPAIPTVEMTKALRASEAQLQQDVVALIVSNFKRGGYFVEFGAAHPQELSNTYMLETSFGWSGLLAEPSRHWHESLVTHRKAHLDRHCVWSRSGDRIAFSQTDIAELSTASHFMDSDAHAQLRRESFVEYVVETISLNDLLDAWNAPENIDYMSIDTEGSEWEILSHYDFSQRSIAFLTVEHNWNASRSAIKELLEGEGYRHILPEVSAWDDWFVLESLLD